MPSSDFSMVLMEEDRDVALVARRGDAHCPGERHHKLRSSRMTFDLRCSPCTAVLVTLRSPRKLCEMIGPDMPPF